MVMANHTHIASAEKYLQNIFKISRLPQIIVTNM